jgi:hypothetical protein
MSLRAMLVAAAVAVGCGSGDLKAAGEECFASSECEPGLTCDFAVMPPVCSGGQTQRPDAAPLPDAAPSAPDATPRPDARPGTPDAAPPDAAPPDAAPPDAAPPDAALPDAASPDAAT